MHRVLQSTDLCSILTRTSNLEFGQKPVLRFDWPRAFGVGVGVSSSVFTMLARFLSLMAIQLLSAWVTGQLLGFIEQVHTPVILCN